MNDRQLVHDYLSERGVVTLITIDRHGYPTGRRVGFINEGFTCWVPTPKGSTKLKQIARTGKALLTAFDPATNKYLQIKADVEVIDDPDTVWAIRERYGDKYPRTKASLTPESRTAYVALKLRPIEVRGDSLVGIGQSTVLRGDDLSLASA
ncbi:MAG: pyridoxamine 5'-phosphate oxidase family protein [Chloroflexota bacterium]|nr:pyridoxamine 5'-phosphate oxidase family protein [Dehalococcoidia bacterium]MDW8252986.1 pyridoxamine 5'-phosphate oxidase family protein [Chloroflexota bacterium]